MQIVITGLSSRRAALKNAAHPVDQEVLLSIRQPTLVIHSREDYSVPFAHAEWELKNIPGSELCEAGFAGHFFWVGPDFARISQMMVEFRRASANLKA